MRALLLLALLGSPVAADEEPVDKRGLAQNLYRDGTDAYAAGRYREAARHFAEAYALTALPALLYNQAQALRMVFEQEGDREAGRRALQLYDRYLAITNLSAVDRSEPSQRRAELAKALAPTSAAEKPRRRLGLWVGVGVGVFLVAGALSVGLGVGLSPASSTAPTVTPRW